MIIKLRTAYRSEEYCMRFEARCQRLIRKRVLILANRGASDALKADLDLVLKKAGIKHLVVTGCTTSICVESTIRDAFFRDYLCVLLTDCTSEPIAHDVPRSNHEASLFLMELMFGWISTSEQFLSAGESMASG